MKDINNLGVGLGQLESSQRVRNLTFPDKSVKVNDISTLEIGLGQLELRDEVTQNNSSCPTIENYILRIPFSSSRAKAHALTREDFSSSDPLPQIMGRLTGTAHLLLPHALVPAPPVVPLEACPEDRGSLCLRVYRGAVTQLTGVRCYTLARVPPSRWKDLPRLLATLDLLHAEEIPVAYWCAFRAQQWARTGKGGSPPLPWTFTPTSVTKWAAWCRSEAPSLVASGKPVYPPQAIHARRLWEELRREVWERKKQGKSDAPLPLQDLMHVLPPSTLQGLLVLARSAVPALQEDLHVRVHRGEWIW